MRTRKPLSRVNDKRGNTTDRCIRKLWMLHQFGDGHTCPCVHCQTPVNYDTVEADRIVPGGPYSRSNVQPACRSCNIARADNPQWIGPKPLGTVAVDYKANMQLIYVQFKAARGG